MLMAMDESILFCLGNLSTTAKEQFLRKHTCNKYCKLFNLDKKRLLNLQHKEDNWNNAYILPGLSAGIQLQKLQYLARYELCFALKNNLFRSCYSMVLWRHNNCFCFKDRWNNLLAIKYWLSIGTDQDIHGWSCSCSCSCYQLLILFNIVLCISVVNRPF